MSLRTLIVIPFLLVLFGSVGHADRVRRLQDTCAGTQGFLVFSCAWSDGSSTKVEVCSAEEAEKTCKDSRPKGQTATLVSWRDTAQEATEEKTQTEAAR